MKNYSILKKNITIFLFIFAYIYSYAQQPASQVKICNDTLIDSKNYQFDVFVRAKQANGQSNFNLKAFQGSFQDSIKNVKGTGVLTSSIVAGSSNFGINPDQRPTTTSFKPLPNNPIYVQINPAIMVTSGMTIYDSATDPLGNAGWVRACTVRLTNSVDYLQAPMNVFFSKNTLYYTTIMANYPNPNPSNGVIPLDTLYYLYNPILNAPITKYNFTGTSSYLINTNGVPLTLNGSQIGCAYKLMLNGVLIDSTEVIGNGNPIVWYHKLAGVYNVVSRRIATYMKDTMIGTATVTAISTYPETPSTIIGSSTLCAGQSNVNYTIHHIVNADNSIWNYSGTGATIVSINDTLIKVSFSNIATSGILSVYGQNTLGTGPTTSLAITVNPLPSNPGIINGLSTVCQGQNAVNYSTPHITNTNSYIWTLPSGTTGSSDSNNITLNYNKTATSDFISVKGHNACGDGSISYLPIIVNPLPSDAGIITGATTVCQGQSSVVYTIPTIANATDYIWTLPNGATGSSNSYGIVVSYNANALAGNIIVKGNNLCGDGNSSTLPITVNLLPSAAGVISGITTVCQGQNNITYSVPAIINASSYVWTLPNGVTGSSSTNTITVNYGTSSLSGNVSVKGHNTCGDGISSNLAITVNPLPLTATTINGLNNVCINQSNVIYTVNSIANASSYSWTLPSGTSGTSTTNTITVTYGASATSGIISVKGINTCGEGITSQANITVNSPVVNAGSINGLSTVCQGQNNVAYSVSTIANATSYIWTLPVGSTGSSSSNAINLSYNTNAQSGIISVKGTNICGDGAAANLPIIVNMLPENAGNINGISNICRGQNNVVYTVPTIANATSYLWTLPSGATGTSNTNSISISYSLAAISGSITVKGINSCGEGATSSLFINVNAPVANAGTISGISTVCQGQTSITYTVPVITNATSYVWNLPSDVTGFSSTNSITTSFGLTAQNGTIIVKGTNVCGDGIASSLAITVTPLLNLPTAQIKICNDSLLDARNYQFEVYIRATSNINGISTFNLKGFQAGFQDSLKNVVGLGTPSVSIVSGSSNFGSLPDQRPTNSLLKPSITNPLYANVLPTSLVTNGMTIYDSTTDPLSNSGWVRACIVKLTNTVDFLQAPMHIFYSKNATYPTIVLANYSNPCPSNGQIPLDTTRYNWSNPILNGQLNTYQVSNIGTTLTLSGSQSDGVIYYVYKNNSSTPFTSKIGTGFPLSWTNMSAGTFTIQAHRIATYMYSGMDGNVVIVTPAPLAAGPIAGNNTVCQSQVSVSYTLNQITYADYSVWNYSGTGATITSINDTTIQLSFSNNATSGILSVYGVNPMGSGLSSSLNIVVNPLPSTTGAITGLTTVCQGQNNVSYAITNVANATSYLWTLPNGASGTSSTNSISINFNTNAISSNIIIKAHNACGDGNSSNKMITVNPLPVAAGNITGAILVCKDQNNVSYSIPSITNATSYNWTLPFGATGNSNTNTIAVNYGSNAVSGNISVNGVNSCGSGVISDLNISINPLPSASGTITGQISVCKGQNNVLYSANSINNASTYVWTLPSGATGTSTTNSISVNYALNAQSGDITLKGHNMCGDGIASTLSIITNSPPINNGNIIGASAVCKGTSNIVYSIPTITYATSYIWTLPSGATGSSTTNSISVNYNTNATDGIITVKGVNGCGESTLASLAVTVNSPITTSGFITGSATVCQGQPLVGYTSSVIANATSYIWTLPTDVSATPSNTNSITLNFGTNSSNSSISVKGYNACGEGPSTSFPIVVNATPTLPTAQIKICNDTLLDARNYQFDIYVRANTINGNTSINLKGFQAGFQDSLKNVKGLGTPSMSIIPGSSNFGTNPDQRPTNSLLRPSITNPLYSYVLATSLTTNGMTIYDSATDPLNNAGWVKACSVKLTNTTDFLQAPMYVFYSKNVLYPTTLLANYLNPCPTNGQIPLDTLRDKWSNPILNGVLNTYQLSSVGTTLTLSGSQNDGVIYYLFKNGNNSPISYKIGNGSTLIWNNINAGTYSVQAHRQATYMYSNMQGSVLVVTPPPSAATQIHGATIVNQGQTNVDYYTNNITYADNTVWNYTGNGATITAINDTLIRISFGSNATSGTLSVYGVNSLGNGTPSTLFINVNAHKRIVLDALFQGLTQNDNTMVQTLAYDINSDALIPKFTNPDRVDTLSVLVRSTNPPDYSILAEYHALDLFPDGKISDIIMPNALMTNNYAYFVINHRNSVEVWSDSMVTTDTLIAYNFHTKPISVQFFGNMLPNTDSYGNYNGNLIWSGDVVQDGIVNIFDLADVFDMLNDPNAPVGYFLEDINGDGISNIFDLAIVFDNMNIGVGSINPFTFKKK